MFVRNDLFEKIIKSSKANNLEFLKLKEKLGLCIYEGICDEKESEKRFIQHDFESKKLKEENENENEKLEMGNEKLEMGNEKVEMRNEKLETRNEKVEMRNKKLEIRNEKVEMTNENKIF